MGEANHSPTCSKAVSAKYNMYTPEERVKIKWYDTKDGPAKTAGHFFQHLDGKLP